RLPVFLARRPDEEPDGELLAFYRDLLNRLRDNGCRSGRWRLLECLGWPDNTTCDNLLAWVWETDAARCLVVVNFSPAPAQGLVAGFGDDVADATWRLEDLDGTAYLRDGGEIRDRGLYVDLPGWGYHVLDWRRDGA
ncbi:MAG TPA: alpha-amylase, partial [Desulfomicrobium sp.]|nr:alpha-amylase [Desulfomicrobium sp.]